MINLYVRILFCNFGIKKDSYNTFLPLYNSHGNHHFNYHPGSAIKSHAYTYGRAKLCRSNKTYHDYKLLVLWMIALLIRVANHVQVSIKLFQNREQRGMNFCLIAWTSILQYILKHYNLRMESIIWVVFHSRYLIHLKGLLLQNHC